MLGHQGICPTGVYGEHNILQKMLGHPSMNNGEALRMKSIRRSVLLRKFHGDRVKADYRLSETVTILEARQAIVDAKEIASVT